MPWAELGMSSQRVPMGDLAPRPLGQHGALWIIPVPNPQTLLASLCAGAAPDSAVPLGLPLECGSARAPTPVPEPGGTVAGPPGEPGKAFSGVAGEMETNGVDRQVSGFMAASADRREIGCRGLDGDGS